MPTDPNISLGTLYIYGSLHFRLGRPLWLSRDAGDTWQQVGPTNIDWTWMDYNNYYFIVGNGQTAMRSIDGIIWTTFALPAETLTGAWEKCTYGNGLWVLNSGRTVRISYDDCYTWSEPLIQDNTVRDNGVFQKYPEGSYGLASPNRFFFYRRRFWFLRYTNADNWLRGMVTHDMINWTAFSVYNTKFNQYCSWQWTSENLSNYILGASEPASTTNAGICSPLIY